MQGHHAVQRTGCGRYSRLGCETDCNCECSICVMDGRKLIRSQPETRVRIRGICENRLRRCDEDG